VRAQEQLVKRASAAKRGYGRKWASARIHYLAKHPTCVMFGKDVACTATATVVDHIIDHKRNWSKFWNMRNWQPMCEHCHNVKTAKAMHPVRETMFNEDGTPTDPCHHWNEEKTQ
jgi:5-methylcytosine-specific restriction protein A